MELRHEKMVAGETEGARRATGVVPAGAHPLVPDPAVDEKPKRRRFTAEYKLRILRDADRCKPGELGALLRREGLYSSLLTQWRGQRDRIAQAGLAVRKRGPKARLQDDPRIKQLERENARLKRRLERAETIIEFQKKLSAMLGIPLKPQDSDEND
jgi:transposase